MLSDSSEWKNDGKGYVHNDKDMLTTAVLICRVEDPRVLLDSLLSKLLLPLPQKGRWCEENHRRELHASPLVSQIVEREDDCMGPQPSRANSTAPSERGQEETKEGALFSKSEER